MEVSNLYIKEVRVDNFKSLKDAKIQLKNGLNFIIGKNGAGKSNILEFIYRFASRNIFSISTRNLITNFDVTINYTRDKEQYTLSYLIERVKRKDATSTLESMYDYQVSF